MQAFEIENRLIQMIAARLSIPQVEVRVSTPFAEMELDSLALVELSGELEEWLNLKLSPILLYDYCDIRSLSKVLSTLVEVENEAKAKEDQQSTTCSDRQAEGFTGME